jgi:hypothetical protein
MRRREAPPHNIWVLCPNKNGDSYMFLKPYWVWSLMPKSGATLSGIDTKN